MRWVIAIVTAVCLLAACGARPDLRPRVSRDGDAQLVAGGAQPVVLAGTRCDAPRPDLRLAPFAIAPESRVAAVIRTSIIERRDHRAIARADRSLVSVSSRGPPRG